MAVLIALALCLSVVAPFQYPGSYQLADVYLPLKYGFGHIFGVNYDVASLFSIPPLFASLLSVLFIASRIIKSMSDSRLLPPMLGTVFGPNETPCMSLIFALCLCALLGALVSLTGVGIIILELQLIFEFAMLSITFILFRIHLAKTRQRSFISPLGIFGAVFALFGIFALAVSYFYRVPKIALSGNIGIMLLLVGYYYWYAKDKQKLNEEESEILLPAYVSKGKLCYN